MTAAESKRRMGGVGIFNKRAKLVPVEPPVFKPGLQIWPVPQVAPYVAEIAALYRRIDAHMDQWDWHQAGFPFAKRFIEVLGFEWADVLPLASGAGFRYAWGGVLGGQDQAPRSLTTPVATEVSYLGALGQRALVVQGEPPADWPPETFGMMDACFWSGFYVGRGGDVAAIEIALAQFDWADWLPPAH